MCTPAFLKNANHDPACGLFVYFGSEGERKKQNAAADKNKGKKTQAHKTDATMQEQPSAKCITVDRGKRTMGLFVPSGVLVFCFCCFLGAVGPLL
jgi:hypothetical protein